MIDGLKVSLTGEELRALLDERAARYRVSAAHWNRESRRTSEDATDDAPLLPEHICRNEAAHQEWCASVIAILRERLDASEVYTLGLTDLEYIGFFPVEPELSGPEESEDSELGPFATRVCDSPEIVLIRNPDVPSESRR